MRCKTGLAGRGPELLQVPPTPQRPVQTGAATAPRDLLRECRQTRRDRSAPLLSKAETPAAAWRSGERWAVCCSA